MTTKKPLSEKHDEHWDAVEEGTELLREGEHDEAVRVLQTVLDGDQRNPYAHFFLAAAYFNKREYELSRKHYQTAFNLTPGYLGAAVGMGHALRLMGRYEDAVRAGRRALDISEDDPDANYLLGLAYVGLGKEQMAAIHLERFIESRPELEVRYEAQALLAALRKKATPVGEV